MPSPPFSEKPVPSAPPWPDKRTQHLRPRQRWGAWVAGCVLGVAIASALIVVAIGHLT